MILYSTDIRQALQNAILADLNHPEFPTVDRPYLLNCDIENDKHCVFEEIYAIPPVAW